MAVWLPEGTNLQLTPGGMGMATLALSLVTVAWVVQALRNDDRGHALMAIAVSLLLGAAYINVVAFGWQQIGLGITSSPQALLIYTITGLHVAMTGVGMLFLAVMGFKAARRTAHRRGPPRASAPPPCTGSSPSPPTRWSGTRSTITK